MDSRIKKVSEAIRIILFVCSAFLLSLVIYVTDQRQKQKHKIAPTCDVLLKNNYSTDTCQCEKFKRAFLAAPTIDWAGY